MKFEIKNDRHGAPHAYFTHGDNLSLEVIPGMLGMDDLLSPIAFFANYMKGVLK